jgi:hypothetical protein
MTKPAHPGLPLAAILLAAALWTAPALAQYGLFHPPKLTEVDVALMMAAAREGLEGKPQGARVAWSNPQTGARGEVHLLRRFEGVHGECREIEQYAETERAKGEPWRQRSLICRGPQGAWQIAPLRSLEGRGD